MAKLNDTVVSGSLRATDSLLTTTVQMQILHIPTTSNGAIFGPGTNGQVLKSNGTSVYWASDTDTNTHRPIQVNGTEVLGNNTTALNLKAGSNVTVTNSSGTVTIAATDTTYSAATQSTSGLMSAADKTKLDGVATGATANVGTITGIKMNGASKGTSGVVDLGTVITAHQDISGKVSGPSSATNNAVAIFDGTDGKTIKNSGFTIGKSVPSDAQFTDTTYTFDGTYNASTNKAATVSTVTNAINALDGNLNSTTPGAGKTLTAFSETNGVVSATFGNISITKSQVSDFPTSMTPASHTHGNIQNGGTLQTTDVAIASGDKLVVTDSSDSNKVARTSLSFDGSTATKALTQKGTWEPFTNNAGTITGITMNGVSKGTSGVVDLGTVITSNPNYIPSTASEYGTAGLVPAPPNYNACLTSRHRWIQIFGSQTITLSAGSWSSATPPTQTVTATLVTANSDVIVGPDSSITNEQLEALSHGKIVCTAQAAQSLTFTCYGTEPTVNIPVTYMAFDL